MDFLFGGGGSHRHCANATPLHTAVPLRGEQPVEGVSLKQGGLVLLRGEQPVEDSIAEKEGGAFAVLAVW
jgi:hypothetical protein